MRKPTPETTRAMTAESSSRRNESDDVKAPLTIQGSKVLARAGASGLDWAKRRKPAVERTREAKTAAEAWKATQARENLRPKTRSTKALAPGMSGMSQNAPDMLSLQVLEVVGPDGLPLAKDEDDDGQPDHGFGRGHGDDKEHDGLAVRASRGPAQGQESEIAGVEHDLDGHELRQEVL